MRACPLSKELYDAGKRNGFLVFRKHICQIRKDRHLFKHTIRLIFPDAFVFTCDPFSSIGFYDRLIEQLFFFHFQVRIMNLKELQNRADCRFKIGRFFPVAVDHSELFTDLIAYGMYIHDVHTVRRSLSEINELSPDLFAKSAQLILLLR